MNKLKILFIFIYLSLGWSSLWAQDDVYGQHTVEAGQTLYSIAKQYFITVEDIKEANPQLQQEVIKVGQTLNIPKTVRNSPLLSPENKAIDQEALFSPKSQKAENNTSKNKTYTAKNNIKVAMFLPLFYENIDQLYFTQYNIEEKKIQNNRSPYKSFSYISFYEGARIALQQLEKQGQKVSLYVFDVGEDDMTKLNEALKYPDLKDVDLIIPLVFKNSFAQLSNFAKQHNIPIVNPMSNDEAILSNEYVFKIQPNERAEAKSILTYIQTKQPQSQVIILFDEQNTSPTLLKWYKDNITSYIPEGSWTIINYKKNAAKLKNYLKSDKKNIIINIIDNKGDNDKVFSNKLIQSLSSLTSSYKISLFGYYRWIDYNNVDYNALNKINFHFTLTYLNDYSSANFVSFVKQYRKNFKTDPEKIYAALGYDIMTYFITGLRERGADFQSNPNIKTAQNMINHYKFRRTSTSSGWQNETTTIYKINNYKIESQWSY